MGKLGGIMQTAIIILNYNDRENTMQYVQTIRNYSYLDKIIVVDNASTMPNEIENLRTLEDDKVTLVLSDKNGGYASGNNVGLRYLEKNDPDISYVIISNPDVAVDNVVIGKCISYLEEHTSVAIVAPRMHFVNGPARRSAWKERTVGVDIANSTRLTQALLFPLFKKGEYTAQDWKQESMEVDAIAGSFFVARRSMFQEIGYFDENTFLFFEEDIIGYQLRQKGYQIVSLNQEKFIHYDSQCIGKLYSMFRKQDIMFDSRIYFHRHYHHSNIFVIFWLQILRYLRKIELCMEVPIRKLCKK